MRKQVIQNINNKARIQTGKTEDWETLPFKKSDNNQRSTDTVETINDYWC